ncbi:MAG: TonB-dependent receptor [Acidobacteria bacterium]|nr:TonB-dependent receptor [Acidobacteriota bacterium]
MNHPAPQRRAPLLTMAAACWLAAACSLAQAQHTSLAGVVIDTQGRSAGQVRLKLIALDTGGARTALTDDGGRYSFAAVLPGRYEVTAERDGFRKEVRTGVVLSLDLPGVLNFTLSVGERAEQITVDASVTSVDTRSGEVGGLIDGRRVSELPLNGRDWLQLAELHPGVVKARSTGAGNTSNSLNGRISVSGQRPNATNFYLDGIDVSVYSQARPPGSVAQGLVLGVEAVREFRIVTSGFSAEYGGKSGGLIDVVSKSGSNSLHGSAYWYHRNDQVDARNFFDPGPLPEFRRHQFGASAGGPVIRNRTFFFVNVESLRELKGETSGDVTPNADARRGYLPNAAGNLEFVGVNPAVAPFLALYPLPNGADFGNGTGLWQGNADRRIKEDYLTARVDHRLGERDSLYGRYTVDYSHASLPFGGNAPFPGFARFNTGRDHNVSIEETHIFSPALLNTARLGFNRRLRLTGPENANPGGLSFSLVPGATFGQLRVGGVGAMGNSGRAEADLVNNVFHFSNQLSGVRGRHQVKFGVDLRRVQLNDTLIIDQNGAMTFPNLRTFLTNTPTLFRGVLNGSDFARGLRFTHAGFYVQDNVQPRPNLTVNLGLRYEPWSNITEVNGKLPVLLNPLSATGPASFQTAERLFTRNPARKNLAPRFSFAWDPFSSGKTSVRGGVGLFFDTPYNGDLLDPAVIAPPFVQNVEVRNPGFPNALLGASGNPPQLAAVLLEYENLNWPSALQYHVAIQRAILPETVLTVSYNGMRAFHLVSRRELNSNVAQTLPDGRKFYPANTTRQNPRVGSMTLFATDSKAWYDGLQMSVNRRLRNGFSLLGSYTFSKALEQAPAAISFTEVSGGPRIRMDSGNLAGDKGLGSFDVRHAFSASVLWEVPYRGRMPLLRGWSLSGFLTAAGGHPFTPLLSFNHSRSGVTGATATTVDRPNLKPGASNNPRIGSPDMWYDPSAFELPQAGFFGNLGRNTISGPGLSSLDLSARKEFRLPRLPETVRLQLRAEVFNSLNHANFDLPGSAQNATSASFLFTDTSGRPNPGATRPIRTVTDARDIQFALRLVW